MKDIKEIQSKLAKVKEGDTVNFTGYTNSSGDTNNLRLKKLANTGYKGLQEESLKALRSDKVVYTQFDTEVTPELWDTATDELMDSITKSLGSKGGGNNNREEDSNYLYSYGWLDLDSKKDSEPKGKAIKTKVKNYIRQQLPVSNYVHVLKLRPGNIVNIS